MHYDKIIVITTYGNKGVPHIEHLIAHNPGIPIHIMYGEKSEGNNKYWHGEIVIEY